MMFSFNFSSLIIKVHSSLGNINLPETLKFKSDRFDSRLNLPMARLSWAKGSSGRTKSPSAQLPSDTV